MAGYLQGEGKASKRPRLRLHPWNLGPIPFQRGSNRPSNNMIGQLARWRQLSVLVLEEAAIVGSPWRCPTWVGVLVGTYSLLIPLQLPVSNGEGRVKDCRRMGTSQQLHPLLSKTHRPPPWPLKRCIPGPHLCLQAQCNGGATPLVGDTKSASCLARAQC
jgi:hypothetical protein